MKAKLILIGLISAMALTACSSLSSSSESTTNSEGTTSLEEVDKGPLTYTSWHSYEVYALAVEVDNYDGDILKSGEYTFSTTNTKLGEAPMYDVYIRDKKYEDYSKLGELDFTVGGAGAFPITRELKKGDYVYIVPYIDLVYSPKGYLEISLNE